MNPCKYEVMQKIERDINRDTFYVAKLLQDNVKRIPLPYLEWNIVDDVWSKVFDETEGLESRHEKG